MRQRLNRGAGEVAAGAHRRAWSELTRVNGSKRPAPRGTVLSMREGCSSSSPTMSRLGLDVRLSGSEGRTAGAATLEEAPENVTDTPRLMLTPGDDEPTPRE